MPQHAVLPEVVLDEAVEERDLEVHVALVGRQRHRPHRAAHVRLAELVELLAHVDAAEDLVVARVDDLEDALALRRVEDRVVERRVDRADARVVDQLAVLRVVVLVRLVAGLEVARRSAAAVSITSTTFAVDADTSRRVPSGEIAMWSARLPSTFVRQTISRVRRSIATTSARLGRETYSAPVVRGEHVVDELVVALADELPDREEVAQPLGIDWISAIRSSMSGMMLIRAST